MNSVICTLFEGNYHYGVAALVNSLHRQGYRGSVYAGYRGELPGWSAGATENSNPDWPGSRTLTVAQGLLLHFFPLDIDCHFANYKPDFMLRLWASAAREAESLFYFDPDIVVNVQWPVFEEWVQWGVALCEDILSPKARHHPIRQAWRHYFGKRGFDLVFKENFYANSGFIGVKAQDRSFLACWQAIQQAMAPAIGGLSQSFLVTLPVALPFAAFGIPDQDALNAAIEAWDGAVSFVDKGGMAFDAHASLMSHAIGTGKPWNRNPLTQLVAGSPPRRADRDYWNAANGPIASQPSGLVRRRLLAIKVAALLSRFYSRN